MEVTRQPSSADVTHNHDYRHDSSVLARHRPADVRAVCVYDIRFGYGTVRVRKNCQTESHSLSQRCVCSVCSVCLCADCSVVQYINI